MTRTIETTTYEYDQDGLLIKEICVIDDAPKADPVQASPLAPFARWEPSWTGRKPFGSVEIHPASNLLGLQRLYNEVHEPAYRPQHAGTGHPSTLPQRSSYVGSHR